MMANLTSNLSNLEPLNFPQGGCAMLQKATLSSAQRGQTVNTSVALKFPIVHGIGSGVDVNSDSGRAKALRRWKREIDAMQSISHPNLLPLLGFCDNPNPANKEFMGIVLPYCANGNASVYIENNPEANRLQIAASATAALFALHTHSPPIIHGDIKAANIMINEKGIPLLGDFGLSRVCERRGFTTTSFLGSLRWMAVELLQPPTTTPLPESSEDDLIVRTTEPSDIWALGMTILELFTGKIPFSGYREPSVVVRVVTHKARPARPMECEPRIGDSLWTLLELCWNEEPSKRPDARHVGLALDIMYGLGQEQVESYVVSEILKGSLDALSPCSQHILDQLAMLPYRCKWLHCLKAFDSLEKCVAHECDELNQRRRIAVGR